MSDVLPNIAPQKANPTMVPFRSALRPFFVVPAVIALIAASVIVFIAPSSADQPASGSVSGTVFRDFGVDGQLDDVDGLEAGIEVRAYDDANNMVGPAVSAADGTYSLSLVGLTETTTNTYRVEFTIPDDAGHLRPGFLGPDNAGPVQFVAADATGVNFAVTNPSQYCDSDPKLAVTCFVSGQADGLNASDPYDSDGYDALVTLPWSGHSTSTDLSLPSPPSYVANNGQIGTTWGLAYQRATDQLFVGAAQRRHTGFGPGGTGMIYRVGADGTGYQQFFDVNSVAGVSTGADPHTGLPTKTWFLNNPQQSASYDAASFDAVGKIGLGDIDISEDEETLWAINLNDRTLLEIPIGPTGAAPNPADVTVHAIGSAVTCPSGVFRPFAVAVRDGDVYIGGVCTGESGGAIGDVTAQVLRHDPSGADGNTTSVYSLPMNYRQTVRPANAECAFSLGVNGRIGCDGWEPWRATWADANPEEIILNVGTHQFYSAPQPMLTDIEIDIDGSIVLAFADRFGMQSGFRNYDDSGTSTTLRSGTTAGDLIRLCNVDGNLTFPCNASGVEHYIGDNAPGTGSEVHPESGWGGIAMHFRSGEVAMTIADPIRVWSGGIGWYDKVSGLISENSSANTVRRYEVFRGGEDGFSTDNPAQTGIGKATGLGDLEILCEAAPLQIGNRVWFDRNGNGRQDPSEPALPGVTVKLLNEQGAEIASTVTGPDGTYSFSSLDIAALGPLGDYTLTFDESTADVSGIDGLSDVTVLQPTTADAVAADDNDDSDIDPDGRVSISTGGAGASEFTFDAGFRGGLQLGDLAWLDINNNGDADDGEPVLAGVVLNLYRENGAAGFDGTEEFVATTVTNAEGVYSFRDLVDGETYYVAVPANQSSTTITFNGQTIDAVTLLSSTGTPTNPVDNNDDGDPVSGFLAATAGIVVSDDPGSEPTGEVDTPPDPDTDAEAAIFDETDHLIEDDDSNLTFDFGFIQSLRVGNLVWLDGRLGEAGFNNGVADAAESGLGIAGVTVELYRDDDGTAGLDSSADTLVTSATTDANGNYWFENLVSGTYIAAIPDGQTGQTLGGDSVNLSELFVSASATTTADVDDVNDGDAETGFASVSAPFTVDYGVEPTDELGDFGDAAEDGAEAAANVSAFFIDQNSNLTVDFSFVEKPTFELGNLVWVDVNDNGIAEAGEPGIGGVIVDLYRSGEDTPLTSVQTDASGKYVFTGLTEGSYFVRIVKDQSGQTIGSRAVDLSNLLASSVNEPVSDAGGAGDVDNDNNGVMDGNVLQSGDVSVGEPDPFVPAESTAETLRSDDPADDDTRAIDANANFTVDFAFVEPLRVGNLVWLDNGGGEPGDASYDPADENDGEADPTESGIAGVLVQLLDDTDTVVAETLTDANGIYVFDGLRDGDFSVAIPADQTPVLETALTPDPNALVDRRSSDGHSATAETSDDDDDGEPADGFASISAPVNLDSGAEADDELGDFNDATAGGAEAAVNAIADPLFDTNSNLEVDFGFAPIPTFRVGNLIWEDFNNNGIAEDGEPGVAGVLVQLLDDNGEVVAETVTDADGHYLFTEVQAGDYQVRVPADQQPVLGAQTGIDDEALGGLEVSSVSEPQPDTPESVDNDSNGEPDTANPADVVTGSFTVGEADTHSEPTGETLRFDVATSDEVADARPDRTELTIDIGFWRGLRLGNLVWLDGQQGQAGYDNGIVDAGELGLVGVTVELWVDADGDGIAEPGGDDGASAVDTVDTDSEGNYLFVGLDEDVDYFVAVPSVGAGFSSTGQSTDPISAASGADDDDDGAPTGDYAAVSDIVTLTVGTTSTGEVDGDNGDDAEAEANSADATIPDGNSELRVDFGFIEVPTYQLGNLVFVDDNANAVADPDESGIAGVLVQLVDADGNVFAETVTDAGGNYLFGPLVATDLVVRIPADQNPELGDQPDLDPTALDGMASPVAGEEPDADNDVDNDDNGIAEFSESATMPDAWTSGVIRLGPPADVGGDIAPPFGSEPADEVNPFDGTDDDPDIGEPGSFPDTLSNLSIDFGFIRMALGNQVWFDTNASGVIDEGEPGINGVQVNIYVVDDDTDELVFLDTTVTGSSGGDDGIYVFSSLLPDENYVVEIPVSQFEPGSPLAGMFSTPDPDGGPVDPNTGGPQDDGVDGDDNGPDEDTTLSQPVPAEPIRSLPVLLAANGEPTDADDDTGLGSDDNENLTVDFGFTALAIGNVVWLDDDGDGTRGESEPLISDVLVELWPVVDGEISGTEPLASTVTDESGSYLFSHLEPGTYVVILPAVNFIGDGPLVDLVSTTGNGVVAPAVDDTPVDDDDNGDTHPTGAYVLTQPFELDWGSEPTVESVEVPGFGPANTDLTIDFGLVPTPPMSLGNRVFADLDNSGDQGEGEPGLPDVEVQLWTAHPDLGGEPLATTTTDPDGYYLFTDLEPGDYVVVVSATNFEPGGVLEQYHPSTAEGLPTDPDDDADLDTDGHIPEVPGGHVVAESVTLVPSHEPSGTDLGPDGHGQVDDIDIEPHDSNLTVDFGFVSLGVGNQVFFDADNSGTLDPDEVGIADVALTLIDDEGETAATTVTDPDGFYLFTGLPPGEYTIVVDDANFDGGPLVGMYSADGNGVTAPAVEPDEIDGDDNGTPVNVDSPLTPTIDSGLFVLGLGLEPTGELGPNQGAASDNNADLTVDFGFYTSTLTTKVGIDEDGNGELDDDEPTRDGTIVEILDPDGGLLGTGVSVEGGLLEVDGLPETTVVIHLPPENFEEGGALSDVVLPENLTTDEGGWLGETLDIEAGPNELPIHLIIGENLVVEAVLGDIVWRDDDRDGVQDPGEPGMSGVTVILRNNDGDEVARTVTDEDGLYLFDNLLPAIYVVEVEAPDGFGISPKDAGSDDAGDSDIDPATSRSGPIDLSAGERNLTIDIGVTPAKSEAAASDQDGFAPTPTSLAFTGTDSAVPLAGAGALLLVAGGALLVLRRRRSAT